MNNIFIEVNLDKEPYIKEITKDKIINLTGESGSGKSYYANQYKNNKDYIVVDTDEIFSRYKYADGINSELRTYFRNKYNALPDVCKDFELIYVDIINYFKDSNKIIIIDSAQFRNIKDTSILKGTIIIMRTSVDTSFQRCIKRYKLNHPNASNDEILKYSNKKKKMYEWYHYLNDFILKVDKI